jgi:hypothetical protein
VDDGIELAVEEHGDPSWPAALLGHGAGSLPAFVVATFGPALAARHVRLVTWHHRGHGASTPVRDLELATADRYAADVGALLAATGARFAGGISLGAHATARWAVDHPSDAAALAGLLLAAPGWVGPPDAVAAANATQADELDAIGVSAAIARVRAGAPPWLAEEVATWWPAHDVDSLVTVLRGLARSSGPTEAELATVATATGIAGLRDDPLHPVTVARRWASAIPGAGIRELPLDDLATDRAALGHAALTAWEAVRVSGSR